MIRKATWAWNSAWTRFSVQGGIKKKIFSGKDQRPEFGVNGVKNAWKAIRRPQKWPRTRDRPNLIFSDLSRVNARRDIRRRWHRDRPSDDARRYRRTDRPGSYCFWDAGKREWRIARYPTVPSVDSQHDGWWISACYWSTVGAYPPHSQRSDQAMRSREPIRSAWSGFPVHRRWHPPKA